MSELTEDEKAVLRRLQKAKEAYEKVPERDRIRVHDPNKFAAPIGVDDEGRPFPVKP